MRHFTVNPAVNENGEHVGGSLGFLKGLQLLIDNINPSEIYVIWEGGGSVRRRSIYKDYKSGRRPVKLNRFYESDIPNTVGNRNYQINLITKLLGLSGIPQLYVADCEADDVIGYLTKYKLSQREIVIVSSDKDYYQLLEKNRVKIWSPGQKKILTTESVRERFGIPVINFCVARCFCGDGSDGLPGIKGAGFRTLSKRFPEITLEEFVSVEEIIKLSRKRSQESKLKLYNQIITDSEIPKMNWKLMNLDVSNLSADQIKKINYRIDTLDRKLDKINFMRIMVKEGIKIFDANKFFMTARSIFN
jgi:DNA polymerase-1